MNEFDKLIGNWNKFLEENPEALEAIKEGYEVAAYDEETGMIIAVEKVDGTVKMKVVEDGYVIRKKSA